jgi:hypothetical protein
VIVEAGAIVGGEAALRDGLRQLTRNYAWFDPSTGEQVALASFVVDWTYGFPGHSSAIPFTSRPSVAAAHDGVLITDGRTAAIRDYDLAGRVRRVLRIDEPARPVTRDMIEASFDLEVAASGPSLMGRLAREYAELPIPDTMPVFASLEVDEMGWLWAELYGWNPAESKEWMVFDLLRPGRTGPRDRAHARRARCSGHRKGLRPRGLARPARCRACPTACAQKRRVGREQPIDD